MTPNISEKAAAKLAETLEKTQEASATTDMNIVTSKQEAAEGKLQDLAEETSARGMNMKQQKIVEKQKIKTDKATHAQKSVLVRKEDADGLAGEFSQRQGNREYHLDPLVLSLLAAEELGEGINADSSPDQVIAIIRRHMSDKGQAPDVAIVDKAFEFLLEVTGSQLKTVNEADKPRLKAIYEKVEAAKNKHFEAHAAEIQVAQKIIGAVDAVVEQTGHTVKETLDRYRDVVHNPPDIQALRKYYEANGYKAMVLELKGLNTYLGGNFKRTNLENPELIQLASAARKMQALLGVYREAKRKQKETAEPFLDAKGVFEAAAAA